MPPKKDAFADLFQSATAGSSSSSVDKVPLSERKGKPTTSGNVPASWNLDILTPSPGPTSNSQSRQSPDPFSIFDSVGKKPDNLAASSPNLNFDVGDVLNTNQNYTSDTSTNQKSSLNGRVSSPVTGSLLDDDFEDAFTEDIVQNIVPSTNEHIKAPKPVKQFDSAPEDDLDETIAQLVDIGFLVEDANRAIAQVGPDLQTCVNFIMGGGKKESRSSQRSRNNNSPREADFGATINDFSSEFFNKASIFFNKSKKNVMKNIEQFQNQNSKSDMPAWMRNQHEYKLGASEKGKNGEKFEDYGSDEDNIDQEAINKFMKAQRERDEEKRRHRYKNIKEGVRNRMEGSSSPKKEENFDRQFSAKPSPASRPGSRPTPPASRPASRPAPQLETHSSSSSASASKVSSPKPSTPDADLLGLGSRAERFKSAKGDDIIPSRRRRPAKTTNTPLDHFQQSDYEVSKEKATSSFSNGDYDAAHNAYLRCLEALPANHELRVVIYSNLALTSVKTGSYKQAKTFCDDGMKLLGGNEAAKEDGVVCEKPVRSWYVKLLSRKAESLEMLELYPESLECYLELVSQFGITDKKTMEARRRVNNIVNPPKAPKPVVKKTAVPKSVDSEAVRRIKKQNQDEKTHEEMKFKLHDEIQDKLFKWSNGKEDNIRTLLTSLPDILPGRLGFAFLTTKKITINDLMLPKKVKINYMKVISAIHPDKTGNFEVEDKLICQGVFVILNRSWDIFKEQNGMN